MLINDQIYGSFEVEFDDLINSDAVQRLKGISQQGLPQELYHQEIFTRYEHSVGVMLLLRKLGASREEQVAGLLHDVSHTAFSHIADYVIGNPLTEDYQDSIHEEYIQNSDLPEILRRDGYSVDSICDHKIFSLLEQDAPLLCADRIDYTLRELDVDRAKEYVDSLVVEDGRIMFSSKQTAKDFALDYLKLQVEHWSGPDSTLRYAIFSAVLKDALKNNVICKEDLFKDDAFVMEKLERSDDGHLEYVLNLLRKPLEYIFDPDPQFTLFKKFRWVDPEYVYRGKVFQVSSTDREFKKLVKKEKEENKKGMMLRISPKRPIPNPLPSTQQDNAKC